MHQFYDNNYITEQTHDEQSYLHLDR